MTSRAVIKSADSVPYAGLSPERVLAVAESMGLRPDGRLFALNSYENRVYRVGCEEGGARVLKFYRAGRWSDAQIVEEHAFATELAAADLPVVAPEAIDGRTLHHCDGFRVACFPLRPGAAPELDRAGTLEALGRTLGRWHARGALRAFRHRPTLHAGEVARRARALVLESPELPVDCAARYGAIAGELASAIDACWQACGPVRNLRLHGDCHLGNILWDGHGPLFVDLDDCQGGPAIQDLWMFLSGSADEQRGQWSRLVGAYEQFAAFDYRELHLIEALRGARMLHHTAWIAARWSDPAFPRAFPDFPAPSAWQRHLNDLQEQIDAVGHPPLLSG